ncbi:hypothetical protein [Allonocardiopsis opalescens]|uniref:Secreted protein n=1 Tax=Allonocardiopsis opalescens TaxID=1144618 RepID=A0A2T0Q282_9ACTN|nr:hypothetical protein [Allonocardiopsis opalescens]PRX97889.1 hypothetical protein CLV72_105241 [Allonocardiopsis opalescens]
MNNWVKKSAVATVVAAGLLVFGAGAAGADTLSAADTVEGVAGNALVADVVRVLPAPAHMVLGETASAVYENAVVLDEQLQGATGTTGSSPDRSLGDAVGVELPEVEGLNLREGLQADHVRFDGVTTDLSELPAGESVSRAVGALGGLGAVLGGR